LARSARSPNVVRSMTAATAPAISCHRGARSGEPPSPGPRGPLDRPQHLADRDGRRRADQLVSPGRSALGFQEPRPFQEEEDLLEVALGNALAVGDLLDGNQALAVVDGEVEKGTDGILAFR
jgi:hypothetical protein